MALSNQGKMQLSSFSAGFVVGYIAAKGFADIQDDEAQPGVTKAVKEALKAMGPGHRKWYHWNPPLTKAQKKASKLARKNGKEVY